MVTEVVPSASLRVFRTALGLLLLVAVVRFAAHGWIDAYFLEPQALFPYAGLEWVRPLDRAGMYALFALMGLAAVGIATGRLHRASALVFSAAFTWVHLLDRTNYLNHYYFVSLLTFLMAWLPLSARALAGPSPSWVLWAIRAQVGVVYVFGGIAKLQPDWLLRAEPLRTWLYRNQDFPVVGPAFSEPWAAYAMSWSGAAFDLLVVPCLLWRRTRPLAFMAVLLFHLTTARLFHIGMFPWIMIACAPIFFAPDWPAKVRAWWRGEAQEGASTASLASGSLAPAARAWPRWAPAACALWIVLQALVSLRSHVYPGDPLWTEEGFRFSWRVMVMEKNGAAEFTVRDPDDGRQWRVLPSAYLTPLQARAMSTQPDMILSFAHLLDREFRARGVRDPEVRADVMVSLNGRPAARLVDPHADLSREHEGLGPRRWVLPRQDSLHAENHR